MLLNYHNLNSVHVNFRYRIYLEAKLMAKINMLAEDRSFGLYPLADWLERIQLCYLSGKGVLGGQKAGHIPGLWC